MSEPEKQAHKDRDDDRDIRALMRETDYSGRLRDDFKRELLREINHNFRYHTLRSRILPVAVVVLIAVSAAWWTTDVGSDGFNLRATGRSTDGGDIVEAPFTHTRVNAPAVDGDENEGLTAAEGTHEQIVAEDATVIRVETWIIEGETVHHIWLATQHDGQPTQVMRTIGASSRFGRKWRDFRSGQGRALLDAIARDSIGPQSVETAHLLGRDFIMGVWTWETSDCGTIVYKRTMQ